MNGACLCGAVTLAIPTRPKYINICNCRLCRSSGAAFGYFDPDDVQICGETAGFRRDDLDEVWLTLHFCPRCGSATHYSPFGRAPKDRIGINMRLFAQAELDGVEVRYQDGRAVESETDAFVVTGRGHIGDGMAF